MPAISPRNNASIQYLMQICSVYTGIYARYLKIDPGSKHQHLDTIEQLRKRLPRRRLQT